MHADTLRESLSTELAALASDGRHERPAAHQHNHHTGGGGGGDDTVTNILLITTDQQRRDSLGCYHDDVLEETAGISPSSSAAAASTPHLDRLAAEGVRFREAYAAAPVCSPSRTSLSTGAHLPVHGVLENGLGSFEPKLRPLAGVLSQNLGYQAALIGKVRHGRQFCRLPCDCNHATFITLSNHR